jgi:gliding motility-associated-like protein
MRIIIFSFCLIIFLSFTQKVYAQGGNTPGAASGAPISLPFSGAGSTCGANDNINFFTGLGLTNSGTEGKDWFYYFCATTTGTVDIFTQSAYGINNSILVFDGLPDNVGTNYLTSTTVFNAINQYISLPVTAGTCYYVMIDCQPTAATPASCYDYTLGIRYHTNPPAPALQPACTNIGYDDGTLSGWIGTAGAVTIGAAGAPTPNYTPLYYSTSATQHVVTSGAGVDPIGGFPIVNPAGGSNSLRLGDYGIFGTTGQYGPSGIPGNGGATLEQKFTVTASNALFVYYYAVVIQDAGTNHTPQEQPFFKTDVFDCSGNAVACGQYLVTGGPGIPGFVSAGNGVYYKNWSPVAVDLTPYIGTCVTVRYTVGDCTRGAHFAYAYIDATCNPLAITGINKVCPTKSTVLTAPVGLFTYSWTPVGATTQTVALTPTTTTTYTCELTSFTNCQTFLTYSVSLYPSATASINSATVCNGTAAAISSTVNNAGGNYTWSPSGGSGMNASLTPSATTIYTLTYSDLNGCQDTALSRVTVNPLPTMLTPANVTVCNNGNVVASAFTSTVASTTFSWTNTSTSIGLAASGSSNTPSFIASNSGASPITAIVSVTPTANSCVGPPINYTITVNPTPNVNSVPSSTFCSGATVPSTNFTGSVTSTVFNWTNTNSTIGASVSGVASVVSFNAANSGTGPISGVITVTPSSNSCTGTPTNYTILVNPIPTVNAVPSATYCSGAVAPSTTFTGNVTSTTFDWTNTNTSIGIAASGVATVASFNATNISSGPILGVITVTPSANSCIGVPVNYTVLVSPIPSVNAVPNATYCSGVLVPTTTFTGNVTNTIFDWTNTNTSIGVAASGVATVSSFNATNAGSVPISGIITVTPSANSCTGTPTSYTVLVSPIPTVNAIPSATYCSGAVVPSTTFTGNVASTTFDWTNTNSSIGAAASGVATVASFNATNAGSVPVSGVITVTPSANSCIGTPTNYTVLVNPIPTVNAIPSATYCSGSIVPTTTFTGNVTSTTFDWTNTNTSIGAGASGVGIVASFNATNISSVPVSGIITVTPSANSCVGTPTNYTVFVNPIPTVNTIPSGTYCSGVLVPTTTFTGNVSNSTYNWTNTNTSIGVGASGVGTVASFNATNSSSSGISGVITVTPAANTCVGTPTNYTVLVNPIPTVNAVPSGTYCSGALVAATTFTGNVTSAIYNWINSNSTIGLGASGSGNIASFTSINAGASSISGIITVTPSANSCVGTPTNYTITVNPNPLAPTVANATICPSSSATLTATAPGGTYKWYDNNIAGTLLATNPSYITPSLTITTTYYVNTTNSFGCISPFTTVDANVLNFLSVSASPNQTICIGTSATLSVNPNGTGYTYSWDSNGNPAFSTIANPVVSPIITTNYSVLVTSSNGCTGTGQTQVFVNPLPVADPGSPLVYCDGQSGSIGASSISGYSYSWLPTTGLSSSTVSNPIVTLSNAGTTPSINDYSLTVTLNGCIDSKTVDVTVNPLPISNAGTPLILCAQQTGSIGTTSTTGYNYSWTPGTNLSSATIANPTVTGVNAGTIPQSMIYAVTTVDASTNCQTTASVTVRILPLPAVNVGLVPAVCQGTSNIPLNGSVSGSVNSEIWSGGAGSFNPNNTILNTAYNPTTAEFTGGSVTLTLTAIAIAPCQNVSSPVVINFYPNPIVNYSVDIPKGCPEHCVNFTDLSTIASPDFIQSWVWNFGDGGTSGLQNPPHCYPNSGLYSITLTATSNHLCSSTLIIPDMVEVYQNPVASFYADPPFGTINDPNISFINTTHGAVSYSWNFGDQLAVGATNTSTLTNPSHAYTSSGVYPVNLIATSIHGCEDRVSIPVEIKPEFTFYIPNAFTPENFDNVNDVFTGMGVGIEKYEMWIFDRWGENIFYTNDIYKGWNGKKLGKSDVVQQDVYIWKVKLTDIFGKKHEYIGHVTLLK